jgi:hypothetical protein
MTVAFRASVWAVWYELGTTWSRENRILPSCKGRPTTEDPLLHRSLGLGLMFARASVTSRSPECTTTVLIDYPSITVRAFSVKRSATNPNPTSFAKGLEVRRSELINDPSVGRLLVLK